MKIDYTPIKILKNYINSFNMIKDVLVKMHIPEAEYLTEDKLFYMLLNTEENPITVSLFNIMFNGMYNLDKNFLNNIKNNKLSGEAEFKDVFMLPLILEKWSKSKQIFKPDPDFADALLHTDKLCISSNMIDHLPYNLFYVDLTACKMFNPMEGAFVHVEKLNDSVYFSVYLVDKNLTYFSFYLHCYFDENNCIIITPETLSSKDIGYDVWKPFCFEPDLEVNCSVDRVSINLFILQLIAYLSIDEPQLTESDMTKNTYRKPNKSSQVKNKWSEVRIQDVGVKYGSDFRKTILKYKNESSDNTNTSKRKSPIPHFRCAHWHKFWIGKGRKTLKVMWIEPVFVGNGEPSNATIHKIKKNN